MRGVSSKVRSMLPAGDHFSSAGLTVQLCQSVSHSCWCGLRSCLGACGSQAARRQVCRVTAGGRCCRHERHQQPGRSTVIRSGIRQPAVYLAQPFLGHGGWAQQSGQKPGLPLSLIAVQRTPATEASGFWGKFAAGQGPDLQQGRKAWIKLGNACCWHRQPDILFIVCLDCIACPASRQRQARSWASGAEYPASEADSSSGAAFLPSQHLLGGQGTRCDLEQGREFILGALCLWCVNTAQTSRPEAHRHDSRMQVCLLRPLLIVSLPAQLPAPTASPFGV